MHRRSSRDFYWRDTSFEGLAAVADMLEPDSDYALYVQYLRLREKGLRPQAFSILARFIGLASRWVFEHRRDVVHRLMTVHHEYPDVCELLPTPLYRGLIIPTLDEWADGEPENPVPFRWRARDWEDLRHAARLDPNEIISAEKLMGRLLASVHFAAHELPNGFGYLGVPDEELACLDEVEELARRLPPARERDSCKRRGCCERLYRHTWSFSQAARHRHSSSGRSTKEKPCSTAGTTIRMSNENGIPARRSGGPCFELRSRPAAARRTHALLKIHHKARRQGEGRAMWR